MIEKCFKQKSRVHAMRNFFLLLLMFFAYSLNGYSQNTVRGTVIDAKGESLPGVSVLVKGTSNGTITDVNGKFSINAPASGTLVISSIGMTTQEVKLNGRRVVNVTLQEDVANLDEVVVIGYGSQKKVHLTGSVSAISQGDIRKTTASNISQTLVGKLPGLVTQQATGAPGADDVTMLVRGYTSYNGTSPLVLVDGVERPMGRLDPNDIESVSILKDAASCAVYGMKGAAGVILVTTKRGKEGKASINYRGALTLSHLTTFPKFMNGTQYMQWYNLARQMDGEEPYFTDDDIAATTNGDPTDGYENTDWQDPLYRTTLMHQHNISINGGSNRTKYYVSAGYLRQNGFIKGHNTQRGNFRSNIDTRPIDNVSVSFDVAARVSSNYRPGGNSYDNQDYDNVVGVLMYSAPFVPQEYQGYPTSGYRGASNPLYAADHSGFAKSKTVRIESSAKIEYTAPFLKGLKAAFFASWDWQDAESKTFSYAYSLMQYQSGTKSYVLQNAGALLVGGNMYAGDSKAQQVLLRPSISYANKFGLHDVSALLLYERTTTNSSVLSGQRTDFPLYDIADLSFGNTISASSGNSGASGKTAYAGYVGRFDYDYANKYLAEFSFRYDGSYLFNKGHRWGFFPSLSLGWVASEEPFFKKLFPKIDRFKLRASIGVLGTDNVSPFLYRKSYGFSTNSVAFGATPTAQNTLYNKVSYPMENLTWEKCRTIDGGFEMTAWNGLLGVEFDAFYKYTYDILQSITGIYPPSLGGHYPSVMNSGAFDNRGFELVLKHTNHFGDFRYNLNANLSYAKNRILRRTQSDNTLPWQNVLGTSLGSIWGLKALGLFQSQEEIDNAPLPIGSTPRLGDIRYADINGDGKITSEDAVKIARSTMPELMYSFMADASWKGFDLSVQFQGGALCNKMLQGTWNNGATDSTPLTRPWYGNWDNAPLYLVENSWRSDNIHADYPRLSTKYASNNAQLSSFWKKNGAYLRLKNVTIGYTIPTKLIMKSGIKGLRLYANGYNLLTFTQFKYLDPESANVIQGYYPQQRTVTFGVDVTF
jgi:TonB-linked SusC/RagA family outer membrane protein